MLLCRKGLGVMADTVKSSSVSMDNGSRGCTASGRPSLLKRAWKEPNLKMYEEKNHV
jgi:hypothetical protein